MASPSPSPVRAVAPASLATTRWSLVLAAGQGSTAAARSALSQLCARYASAVYAFLRSQGRPPEMARELTQRFFVHVLEMNDLSEDDPARSRFRSWLLASLERFLAQARDGEQAVERGGVLIDLDEAERQFEEDSRTKRTPARAFERRWALALLEHVVGILRKEYARSGKGALFEKLEGLLTGNAEDTSPRIAAELGITVGAVKVAADRLRRRYREVLLDELSHTVDNVDDVDDELHCLMSTLAEA